MAQHKAPTAVTIAPIHEKSGPRLWLERYWKVALGVVLAVVVWIVYQAQAKSAERSRGESAWSKVLGVASEESGVLTGSPDALRRVEGEVRSSAAGAWALYIAATSALAARDFDKAESALSDLRQNYPNHPLVTQVFSPDGEAPAESVVDQIARRLAAQRAFIQSRSDLFGNPALPSDAPRVRLNTDKGPIVVGLYSDLAPKCSENFLKLVREGSYVGTKFHSVRQGEAVQGGDPNSVAGPPDTWGKGGPGYSLEKEDVRLRHFSGVLSAVAAPLEPDKISGSQFLITTADAHVLDQGNVVFGKVLEGMELVHEIERAPLAENTFDHPRDPVTVQSAEVL